MNGYGTIDQIFRPLGIGTIRPGGGDARIIFTANAVRGGLESLVQENEVEYRTFNEDIAGVKFARDVWKKA
jgi:hypothetical protein